MIFKPGDIKIKHVDPETEYKTRCLVAMDCNAKLKQVGIPMVVADHQNGKWYASPSAINQEPNALLIMLASKCDHPKNKVKSIPGLSTGFQCECGAIVEPGNYVTKTKESRNDIT